MNTEWCKVTKADPCPICRHPDWCTVSVDGEVALCGRIEQGSFQQALNGGGYLHRLVERKPPCDRGNDLPPVKKPTVERHRATNWADVLEGLQGQLTPERLSALSAATGVPEAAWQALSPGWANADDLAKLRASGAGWKVNPPAGAWVFAERDGHGRVVGLSLRAEDGSKGFCFGGNRGLSIPAGLSDKPDPVLIVEGASDVAALTAIGLAAVGRPNNRGGGDALADLLDGRSVLVVGENDQKDTGAWPGRDGAKTVAQQIAGRWVDPVSWCLPPHGVKDVRAWLNQKIGAGLDLKNGDAVAVARQELLAALQESPKVAKPQKRRQADCLLDLAKELCRIGRTLEGEAFAVRREGPNVAIMLRGNGLRGSLAAEYQKRTGKAPSSAGLTDALATLEGQALSVEPERVELRVAEYGGGVVLDLGDQSGRAVVVHPDGWAIEAVSPVLFRRTPLTLPLPEPEPASAGELVVVRRLLNVDDENWPLAVGWMVAAMLPGVPHPILMLDGEQGTGKSSAARVLMRLTDPSSAPLRSEPRDAEQWAVAAAGSWVVCLDNVSHVSGSLSDMLCKAVTGDGVVRRKLYTDGDLAVLSFRRCIMLTSIDPGALRGDLGDRLLRIELHRIPDNARRTETELERQCTGIDGRCLGALLSAVAATLAALPYVHLETMPRMADFAKVLAALDRACPELTGGRALALFTKQRSDIAVEVVDSDPVASAVVTLMQTNGCWEGSASELLEKLTPAVKPKHWPETARSLAGRLKRIRPALLAVGIQHTPPAKDDKARIHRLEMAGNVPPEPPEPPEPQSEQHFPGDAQGPSAGDMGGRLGGVAVQPPEPQDNRPADTLDPPVENDDCERSGGMGGAASPISEDDWGQI